MIPQPHILGEATHSGAASESASDAPTVGDTAAAPLPPEFGGREGPEPTRFGDWEKNGRCIDF
jgi:hypothetical protein